MCFSIRESDRCLETLEGVRLVKDVMAVSVSASRIVASKPPALADMTAQTGRFQYPRVGSLPRNFASVSVTVSSVTSFSIRESDRCLETSWRRSSAWDRSSVSVSASRIVASKPFADPVAGDCLWQFQYPRVGSLPRNPSIVASEIGQKARFSIRESDRCLETQEAALVCGGVERFSIRESDRCLETPGRTGRHAPHPRVSVSASRIVASKLEVTSMSQAGRACFSIRESDRCLETDDGR